MEKYKLYKGLQKPIIYKGFKGKYILWGVVIMAAAVVTNIAISNFFNFFFAVGASAIILVLGLGYTLRCQKKGLHKKTVHSGIFSIQANLTKYNRKRYG